jgi:alpha-beta hydrolase superfamily lysophospholipase
MSLLSIAAAALISQAALAADVTLKTADGIELHGVHEPVQGAAKAVLLVHGERRTANDWKFLQGKIENAGMASLAIDLRGHGGSQAVGVPPLPDEAYQAMTADVTAGLAYLRERGATELMLVGAELGATLALSAGAEAQDTTNIVLLSPSLKVHGIRTDAALKAWGERSVLFVVSSDDPYSAKSALLLEAQARGPRHMEIYAGAGKGAAMLNREPACEGLVLSWLLGSHTLTDQQAAQSGPQISEDGGLEAEGMELEEVMGR